MTTTNGSLEKSEGENLQKHHVSKDSSREELVIKPLKDDDHSIRSPDSRARVERMTESMSLSSYSSVRNTSRAPKPTALLSFSILRELQEEHWHRTTNCMTASTTFPAPSSSASEAAEYKSCTKRTREDLVGYKKGEESKEEANKTEDAIPSAFPSDKKEKKKQKKTSEAGKTIKDTKWLPPPFKVGTLEMYKRFPEAYDRFMRHHDCTAIQGVMFQVLDEVVRSHGVDPSISPFHRVHSRTMKWNIDDGSVANAGSSCVLDSPFLKVMDLGCGTGRIEEMVVHHPFVGRIYAYDKEPSMLQRCILNTLQAAAKAGMCVPCSTTTMRRAKSALSAIRGSRCSGDGNTQQEEEAENDTSRAQKRKGVNEEVESDREKLECDKEEEEKRSVYSSLSTPWNREVVHVHVPSCDAAGEISTESRFRFTLSSLGDGMRSPEKEEDRHHTTGRTPIMADAPLSLLSPSNTKEEMTSAFTCCTFQHSASCSSSIVSSSFPSAPSPPFTTPTRSSMTLPLDVFVRPVSFEDIRHGFLQRRLVSASPVLLPSPSPLNRATSTATHPACHVIVCAWSLSYLMRQQWGADHWHASVDEVLQQLWDRLDVSTAPLAPSPSTACSSSPCVGPKAALVIIETLGTGRESPSRHNTFTERLEQVWGFEKHWVRTDYTFPSREEAVAYTQFFFGKEMARQMATTEPIPAAMNRSEEVEKVEKEENKIEERETEEEKGTSASSSSECLALQECTGIWIKWKTAA